jgi:multidrug efflux pump subunit AcrB
MTKVFEFFVVNWRFSFLMTAMIALMGILGLGILQRETFPPVNFATVSVVTIYPGATPEDVYDRVTRIIENELRGTTGLKDVKSISQSGRSTITIRIDIDRPDPQAIVNEIQRAVTRANSLLPAEVLDAPLVTEVKAKEIPVIELALIGPNENRERDRYVEDLKEVFDDVRGVASVRYSGYIERELQILLDREKLQRLNVGISEVVNAMKARLKNIPAGSLETADNTTLVRLVGQSSDPKEIENLVIRSNDSGVLVRISQVGRVVDASKRPNVLARVNGEPATLMIVTKKEEVDSISVVDALVGKMKDFQTKLPSTHKVVVYNDEGSRIKNRLEIVQFNAIFGLLAVLGILFVFLPGKVGLWSSASLPICALGTVAFMVYLGANFNTITMIAIVICLGNLVDNSVVVSEHYTTLREKGMAAQEAAVKSAEQFWIPFTASTITIIAAFLPMLVTEGVLGQFIKWIPIVVSIALVLSLVEALTLLPARLQFLETKKKVLKEGAKQESNKIEDYFGRFVRWTVQKKYITAGIMTALVVSGVFVTALFNRFELFPADGVEYYIARFEAPPQTLISKVDAASAKLSNEIAKVLGDNIDSIIARSGIQQVGAGDPKAKNGDNVGFLLIRIKNDRYLNLGIEDTLKKLREIKSPPELSKVVFETIQGGPPVGKPVTVTMRSTNTAELEREAKEFKAELAKVSGLRNVETDLVEAGREYSYKPNDERVAFVGLNLDLVGLNLRAAIEGLPIAQLTDRGLEYDVTVKYDSKDREDIEDIQQTRVTNSSGNQTPLNMIGKISETNAPSVIRGYDFRRSITITGDINETLTSSGRANAEARKILQRTMSDAKSTSTVFGGVDESTKDSLRSLGIALVLSIIGIFATLVFTFKSYSKPFIILSSIPLGLVGVLYSFALNQRPLSFLAFIGVVGLSGVVINSAIILVDFIEELRRESSEMSLTEILIRASQMRLRAVLATGLTTVVGLLPTAFGLGGNDPLLIPITLALSWGMIVGTVLSLIWIPSAYLILEDFKRVTRVSISKVSSLVTRS